MSNSALNLIIHGVPFAGSSLHPDTSDLVSRINAAGSSISSEQIQAVNGFVTGVYQAGIRSKILDCGLFVGDDLTAARQKLWYVNDSELINNGFVEADYSPSGGLDPGNPPTTKYLDTGESPSTLGLIGQNTHLSYFSLVNVSASSARDIGVIGVGNFQLILNFGGSNYFYRSFQLFSAIESYVDLSSTDAYFLAAAGGATEGSYLQRNGVEMTSSVNGGDTSPSLTDSIAVFRATNSYGNKRSTGYTIGEYLTQPQASSLNEAFQDLRIALGR